MDFHGRQTTERIHNFLVREVHRLVNATALDKFSRHAGTGDGRAATEGLEASVLDDAILDLEAYLHDVATGCRTYFANGIGVLQIAHVAWVQEVFHHGLIVECVRIAHDFDFNFNFEAACKALIASSMQSASLVISGVFGYFSLLTISKYRFFNDWTTGFEFFGASIEEVVVF